MTLVPLTLNQALTGAGGATTQTPEYTSIRLFREGRIYQIPLNRYRRDPGLQNLALKSGDAVFVDQGYDPETARAWFDGQIRLADLQQRSRAGALAARRAETDLQRAALNEARANYQARRDLGAEAPDFVYLTGEVRRQGRFALPPDRRATLADALYEGGGGLPVETANIREIYVLRAAVDPREFAAVTAWHLDARNAANLLLTTRFELRPNDVIFVAEQPVTRWGRVVRQITPSLLMAPVAAAN